MSRLLTVKAVFASIVAVTFLALVASAGAAAWQPPLQISDPPVNLGDTTARISLGTSGAAGAGWSDEGDGVTARTVLARRPVGGAWSTVVAATGQTSQPILVGTDAAGDVTAAYSSLGITQIVSWAAGAATPTTVPVTDQMVSVQDLAVNASGDAVISGIATGTNDIRVAYRHGFTGAWSAWHSFTGPALTGSTSKVAINAAGVATVAFRATTEYWAATRTTTTDWPTAAEQVTFGAVDTNGVPSVAIDGAGGVYTAYVSNPGAGVFILHTAYRSAAAAVWEESGPLTTAATGFSAQIVMNPAGTALLVWQQTSATAIQAKLGSTGNRIWEAIPENVNDAGAEAPVAAISNDGTAIVAWERATVGGNLGQASVRSPGATGTWGDIHNLTALHANGNQPSISTDGRGDFATISAPYDGTTAKHAVVSIYDASPPTVSAPSVTGTLLAGDPLVLGVNASDEWSAVGTPAWTFGDGGTGTGLTPVHTYATAGTFTAHVTVTDGSGNSSSKDVSVTVGSPQSTLTSAKFAGKWKVSLYTGGTLTVAGAVPRAGSYTIDVLRGTSRVMRFQDKLTAGAFTRKIKLTGRFFPGSYNIVLTPGDAQVKGASQTASIAAPAEGVVDIGFLSGARNGTAARTLTGVKTIWANFHFAAKPKGTLTLTWYRVGKKHVRIGSTKKSSAVKIVSFLRIGGTFSGTYQAVLSRKGVVIARASVKAKKG
jgi:PKD domain